MMEHQDQWMEHAGTSQLITWNMMEHQDQWAKRDETSQSMDGT